MGVKMGTSYKGTYVVYLEPLMNEGEKWVNLKKLKISDSKQNVPKTLGWNFRALLIQRFQWTSLFTKHATFATFIRFFWLSYESSTLLAPEICYFDLARGHLALSESATAKWQPIQTVKQFLFRHLATRGFETLIYDVRSAGKSSELYETQVISSSPDLIRVLGVALLRSVHTGFGEGWCLVIGN